MPTLRRTELRPALALVAVLALGLSACSSDDSDSSGPEATFDTDTTTTPAATGPVDSFTWYGDYRSPATLDPIKVADYPELTVIPNLCESLLDTGPGYEPRPGLASAWEQVDPRTVRFTLRDDVTFSDGTPMTREDVLFSLRRNLDPALASSYSILYQGVAAIEPSGTDQVEVTFTEPNAVFLKGMNTLGGAIISKAFAETHPDDLGTPGTGVLCTGPYVLDSWDGVGPLTLKRSPDYWNSERKPLAEQVRFEFPAEAKALANAIRTGAVDGGFNIPAEVIPSLRETGSGELWLGAEGSTPQNLDIIVSDLAEGPLADPAVRRALSGAVDREALVRTAFAGAADPLYTVAGPGLWGYAQERYRAAYEEIERASKDASGDGRAAVDQAGLSGERLTLAYPGGIEMYRTTATVVQQAAKELGLDMEIVALPLAQYYSLFSDASVRADYDAFLTMNYTQVQEPAFMYGFIGNKDGSQNYGGYDNPEVDRLLREAFGEPDDDARADLVIAAQAILAEELPWIPLVAPRAAVYLDEGITGVPLTFAYMGTAWTASVGAP